MAGVAKTVCVSGAGGFIASHIVKQLLEKGYTVRGTVRNAADKEKNAHLWNLPGASERLQLFSAELLQPNAFDEPVQGCFAVFHTASPLPNSKATDPEAEIIKPAVEGTLTMMRSCIKSPDLKVLVVTSSMAAIAPVPEPDVKSEEHWSDPEGQKSRGSHYGASKTLAERAVWDFAKSEGAKFRICTICPTLVLGPMLQASPNATNLMLKNWLTNGRPNGVCPNDSWSFVDVRDCAAQHVAAMELETASGRYMSLECSWHWNELNPLLQELYPAQPPAKPCEGEPKRPTQFDYTRQKQLGVELRKVPQILKEAIEELKAKGLLD